MPTSRPPPSAKDADLKGGRGVFVATQPPLFVPRPLNLPPVHANMVAGSNPAMAKFRPRVEFGSGPRPPPSGKKLIALEVASISGRANRRFRPNSKKRGPPRHITKSRDAVPFVRRTKKRRRKQIPRRRNLDLKSNVGRFAPLADPRDRSPKIWTWAPPPDNIGQGVSRPLFFAAERLCSWRPRSKF